jgi:hypothetical protein
LEVSEWLRYPWFPYNYNLLYAAALVFGNDILPHLIHSSSGWLVAVLLYRFGRPRFDRSVALLAALTWLLLVRTQFGNAYVDMGLALFAWFGFVCFVEWWERREIGWLALAAFGMGLAVGTKYQALTLLPFFAGALLIARPSPRQFGVAALAFGLPCLYWYARNALMTGDPVAPLGGKVFGFSDWNLADYQAQFEDLRRVAALPSKLVWPSLFGCALAAWRARGPIRLVAAYAAYLVLAWAASSRYPRYLIPAYPVLALFSVTFTLEVLSTAGRYLSVTRDRLMLVMAVVLLAGAVGSSVVTLRRTWPSVASSREARELFLAERVTGYRMWSYLREHPAGRIYQFELEDGIYYAPQPIWGDVFGPWRYADYAALGAPGLRSRLSREGFDSLLVHVLRGRSVLDKPGFSREFLLVHQEGDVQLFSIRKGPSRE